MSQLTETILISVLTGVVASLVASLVFWTGLYRLKPRLLISDSISRTARTNGKPGSVFRFKIINQSRRTAVGVQVQAFVETRRKNIDGHYNRVHLPLELLFQSGSMIPGRKRKDPDARHARRVVFKADLDAVWTDPDTQSILIRVLARDGSSGSIRQFEQMYHSLGAMQDGEYGFGDDCKVHPVVKRVSSRKLGEGRLSDEDSHVYPTDHHEAPQRKSPDTA